MATSCETQKIFARGFCSKHYSRWHRHGTPYFTAFIRDGRTKHPLKPTYVAMLARCTDKNGHAYKDYGGRGITVCKRWLGRDGFNNFLNDMGERPKGYSLDRIDNDKGYSPDNCRWTDNFTQARNRRVRKSAKFGMAGIEELRNGKFRVSITRHGKKLRTKTLDTLKIAILNRRYLEATR